MTIKNLRKEKGLTLHQLSDLSGISVTQIHGVESGRIKLENMTVKNFMALCDALEVDAKEVYKGKEKQTWKQN